MKDCNEEYFYMIPVGNTHPVLEFIHPDEDRLMLFEEHKVSENHLVEFQFKFPIPWHYRLADVHGYAQYLVVSDKIKNILAPMNLKNMQFLPATIKNPKTGDIYSGYWALHIYNLICCLDRGKSIYETFDEDDDHVFDIEKLVLDNRMLEKIPLEERLVFALGEEGLEIFFHISVAEKIIAAKPKGVMFCPLTKCGRQNAIGHHLKEYMLEI